MLDTLASKIVNKLVAIKNCHRNNNLKWLNEHKKDLDLLLDKLPHGNGLNYSYLASLKNNDDELVINSSYHAMNEHGFYNRVINFTIVCKPSLLYGLYCKVSGNFGKYQYIKHDLEEMFNYALSEEVSY